MIEHNNRREFFDYHAPHWDDNYPPEIYRRAVEVITSLQIKGREKILDLGCGNGVLFPILRELTGGKDRIFGLDFSYAMLKQIPPEFKYNIASADAAALPFPPDYFQRVIAFAAFPHFDSREIVLNEICRVLKYNGFFHVIHLLSSDELRIHHHHAGGAVKDDILPKAEEFKKILMIVGFREIEITDKPGLYLMKSTK